VDSTVNKKIFEVLIYPTDTVWGIGAPISNTLANNEIRSIKNNSSSKPFSIMFQNLDQFNQFIQIPLDVKININEFYQLGATFLLPVSWIVNTINKDIYANSSFIGARIATKDLYKKIKDITSEPITTTSLNLEGDPPILNEVKAKEFQQNYAKQSIFIPALSKDLTGTPSTIISIDTNYNLKVVREGSKFSLIQKILEI
jgi:L-threonylcarbamoyladenylate synthase